MLAQRLGLDPIRAAAVAGEIALLEAGGCPCCCARRIADLTATSSSEQVRGWRRKLLAVRLVNDDCVYCEAEAA